MQHHVVGIACVARAARVVGRLSENTIRNCVVEDKLRSEFVIHLRAGIGPDAHVNVHGPSAIPAWINADELNRSVIVRDLVTAQVLFAHCVIGRLIGVSARGIAVPDINMCAG